ncbi:hypothetical protein K491DRAFT_713599 [Lophiostoma macrostomum CBS 122681]|uniref:EKC/KEOPS complex subunit GON7 n=1 Tax=Lophiostoma macrostomum CBS 122681 TaxID=1314788 RepID=A0A6A6TGS6_9PLEO|nr:hypothetical protein K491DRAFT_713599 [Lophiostoma macrostomum CBS 122681]
MAGVQQGAIGTGSPAKGTNATYTSPSTSHTLTTPLLSLPTTPSTSDRVAYLSSLLSATKDLQASINTFLTQKMDEDKAAAGKDVPGADVAEEENYGEEVVEGR